jgi:hypothetical protein
MFLLLALRRTLGLAVTKNVVGYLVKKQEPVEKLGLA